MSFKQGLFKHVRPRSRTIYEKQYQNNTVMSSCLDNTQKSVSAPIAFYIDSTVRVKIRNIDCIALVDSGSEINCIQTSVLRKAFPFQKLHLQPSHRQFISASNDPMRCRGSVYIDTFVGKELCSLCFYVFDSLSQNIILGRDFLVKNKVKLDYLNNKIHFECSPMIKAANSCKIEPKQTCLIIGIPLQKNCLLPTGLNGEIQARKKCNGMQIESIACTVSENSVPILVHNTSLRTIKIKKGSNLSKFHPLSENECHKFSTNSIKRDTYTQINKVTRQPINYNLKHTVCTQSQKRDLLDLLNKNQQAFISHPTDLGKCDLVKHHIQLKNDAKPIFKLPYRVSPEHRMEIEKQIKALQEQGVIIPIDNPQWCSPLVIVKKGVKKSQKHMPLPNSGKPELRLVIDFRHLNASSIYGKLEIPRIPDLIDTIGRIKPRYFTSLDLRSGYWQQCLTDESIPLTSFLWNGQAYAFTRTAQGLSGAPMSFQLLINKVLRPFLGKNVVAYLDDILVFSNTFEEHLHILNEVFRALKNANLKLNPSKCKFATNFCEFLGFNLSERGIQPSQSHVEALKSYPAPKNIKEVRTFIGLVQFFKDFIPKRASLTSPLTALTRKNATFTWTDECQTSFEKLKDILISSPVLAYPDFTKRFYVITDASTVGIGGCLTQLENGSFRPVAYCGRATSKHERKLTPATGLEALAAVWCVTKWEVYLTGRPFTLITDCSR